MEGGSVPTVVLVGFESAGKTALFRGLTGQATGDEANFRGSTVMCRKGRLDDQDYEVVDTPGIRDQGDSETTRLALAEARSADTVLLVARGTDLQEEVEGLLRDVDLWSRRAALAVTFADKAPLDIERLAAHYTAALGVPSVALDARNLTTERRGALLRAIGSARKPLTRNPEAPAPVDLPGPQKTLLEHRVAGPGLSLLILAAMFGVPVWLAYRFAAWLQPIADSGVVEPAKAALASHLSPLIAAVLTGSYGLLTLGWYSFLWAFPVVLLIGISVALCEETGLNDRMTRALDPPLRLFGLAGRDLLPVLTGYGCNVVAVFQSRTCSRCSRGSCVSMIAFGSACSYQIGASLSLFGSSGHPGLFIPYLVALFLVGAVHTRLWYGRLTESSATETVHTFLQRPSARAVWWRIRAVVKQFLLQAMPMFLAICAAAALMAYFGLTGGLSRLAAPVMGLFRLPADAAPGIVFSVLRKDGLLTLNQDQGAWLQARTAGEVFILVWLASTLTACLVTLWTVRREFGWRFAFSLAGKQVITSLVTALIAAWAIV